MTDVVSTPSVDDIKLPPKSKRGRPSYPGGFFEFEGKKYKNKGEVIVELLKANQTVKDIATKLDVTTVYVTAIQKKLKPAESAA